MTTRIIRLPNLLSVLGFMLLLEDPWLQKRPIDEYTNLWKWLGYAWICEATSTDFNELGTFICHHMPKTPASSNVCEE